MQLYQLILDAVPEQTPSLVQGMEVMGLVFVEYAVYAHTALAREAETVYLSISMFVTLS